MRLERLRPPPPEEDPEPPEGGGGGGPGGGGTPDGGGGTGAAPEPQPFDPPERRGMLSMNSFLGRVKLQQIVSGWFTYNHYTWWWRRRRPAPAPVWRNWRRNVPPSPGWRRAGSTSARRPSGARRRGRGSAEERRRRGVVRSSLAPVAALT